MSNTIDSCVLTGVVTAQLICAFVFTYANCWFSYVAPHIKVRYTGIYIGLFSPCIFSDV